MENSIGVSYMSTPTSPYCCSQENLYFYSVPTSPTRGIPNSPSGYQTDHSSPRIYEDANSYLDDFEFETSLHFDPFYEDVEKNRTTETRYDQQQQPQAHQRQRGGSLPPMAFADELFCDGKVMPLVLPTLKLPPRLQNGCDNKFSNQSSTTTSPRSPTLMLKLPFSSRSFWNDDFDPFMVALEKIKTEKKTTKSQGRFTLTLAKTLSPFRATRSKGPNDSPGLRQSDPNPKEVKAPPSSPMEAICKGLKDPIKQVGQSPRKLAEPKGLLFARRMRLVKMDNDRPSEPNKTSVRWPTMKAGDDAFEREGHCTRESKSVKKKNFMFRSASVRTAGEEDKPKVKDQNAAFWKLRESKSVKKKNFMFRSASVRTAGEEDKLKVKDQSAAFWKLTFLRKFRFKSVKSAQCNENKKVAVMTKMTLIHYKPRLFLCLGYGKRHVK
ncbi:Estrogen receptor beta-1 like [Quillaja saponaria]|uniref:Estrogen receptor beta-1 like n=1 Tax=Quillaja saponaria TaxID=32244 RepID=A0AAD7LVR6_QUISA|nr:Estrogen receptor beta-1 like [Quillaja saponaria]